MLALYRACTAGLSREVTARGLNNTYNAIIVFINQARRICAFTEQGRKGTRAEGFSIPVDWNISIDDEGHATVDDASGRITADTDSNHGSKEGDSGRLPGLPADREKKEDGGKGDRFLTHHRVRKLCQLVK